MARVLTLLLSAYIVVYNIAPVKAQGTPQHISDQKIYELIDELASLGLVDVNSLIKPYPRGEISRLLTEAQGQSHRMSQNLKKRVALAFRDYSLEGELQATLSGYRLKLSQPGVRLKPPGLHYRDSLTSLSIRPLYGARYWFGANKTVYQVYGGVSAFANIGKNWSFYFNLRDVNEDGELLAKDTYLTRELGGNYKENSGGKTGGDYSEMRGGLVYSWKWGHLGLVKDHIQWGEGYNGTTVLSGRTPSFAMVKLHLKPSRWFDFNYIHGWLVSEEVDSTSIYQTGSYTRQNYRQKYIAANFYTFTLFRGTKLSLGNSIVYSDKNVQAAYLIPFLFFKSVDHTINASNTDNENSQMFFSLSSRTINHFHLYSTLFVDELSTKRFTVDSLYNFWGVKLGGRLTGWPLNNVSLTYEFTKTSPITYTHRVPSLTYASNKYTLGHYLGDNAREHYVALSLHPFCRLYSNISYTLAQKGNEYIYDRGRDAVLHPYMESVTWRSELISVELRYEILNDVFLRAEYLQTWISGYETDGNTAQYYLDRYTPGFLQGNNQLVVIGFSMGI